MAQPIVPAMSGLAAPGRSYVGLISTYSTRNPTELPEPGQLGGLPPRSYSLTCACVTRRTATLEHMRSGH